MREARMPLSFSAGGFFPPQSAGWVAARWNPDTRWARPEPARGGGSIGGGGGCRRGGVPRALLRSRPPRECFGTALSLQIALRAWLMPDSRSLWHSDNAIYEYAATIYYWLRGWTV